MELLKSKKIQIMLVAAVLVGVGMWADIDIPAFLETVSEVANQLTEEAPAE